MANWTKKLPVNSIIRLNDENNNKSATKIAGMIADLLTKEYPNAHSDQSALYVIIQGFRKAKTQARVNKLLEQLYNWADVNLVWLDA